MFGANLCHEVMKVNKIPSNGRLRMLSNRSHRVDLFTKVEITSVVNINSRKSLLVIEVQLEGVY